ncbi:hypothetical protein FCM35_KLT18893 [Carex littledalei]|uniref:Uncharacterized protein n=1 Tax=Carex littledalei TaxID=544730 RepID=A0A833RDB8_9POAL|nr:hypothetical protein FCM35_KLT18893 [Carex littledalei]
MHAISYKEGLTKGDTEPKNKGDIWCKQMLLYPSVIDMDIATEDLRKYEEGGEGGAMGVGEVGGGARRRNHHMSAHAFNDPHGMGWHRK